MPNTPVAEQKRTPPLFYIFYTAVQYKNRLLCSQLAPWKPEVPASEGILGIFLAPPGG